MKPDISDRKLGINEQISPKYQLVQRSISPASCAVHYNKLTSTQYMPTVQFKVSVLISIVR